ncbi:MAG: tetratricopeptide repeat protein [Bacteroidales bacterium]|nr:tetratricopeptide repeat protein [Bacteroidales bacterium]
MKKLTVVMAFIAMCLTAGAQSLNLSSAYEAQNRGYLKKAKGYIDQAAVHEQTKAEPQTWFYSTLIYCKIGGEIQNKTKQGKELASLCPDWYRTAYQSVMNWKQFDKDGEYTEKISPFFAYIGNVYYDSAYAVYKRNQFERCMSLCDTAISIFNMGQGNKQNTQVTYYLAGAAASGAKDNAAVKKYYNPLVQSKYDNDEVYKTLFALYKNDKDTVNAVKIANTFRKNFPNNIEADQLMAQAYLLNGNMEKAMECLTSAISKQDDNPQAKASLLCAVAGLYDNAGQFDKAVESYNQALAIDPKQYAVNYGMGSLYYNRAVDKLNAANDVDPNDETGLYDKLRAESNECFSNSSKYFQAAIDYIDGLDEKGKKLNEGNLISCLYALRTVYSRIGNAEGFQAVNERYTKLTTE